MFLTNKSYMVDNIKNIIKLNEETRSIRKVKSAVYSDFEKKNGLPSIKKIIRSSSPSNFNKITSFTFRFNSKTFVVEPMEFGVHSVVNAIQSLLYEIWILANEKNGASPQLPTKVPVVTTTTATTTTNNVQVVNNSINTPTNSTTNDIEDIFLKIFANNNLNSIKSIRKSLNGLYDFEKFDSVLVKSNSNQTKLENKLNLINQKGTSDFEKLFGIIYFSLANGQQLLNEFISIRLKLLLEKGFKDCQIQTYGSYLSDLSLDESDIDVNFTIGNGSGKDDVELLNSVAAYLNDSGNYEIEQVVRTAKVPIIKFQDKSSKINFDLCNSSSMPTHVSLLLREYVKIDKKVKDLILLVKWWATKKSLNSASEGSFSSFCLANMVIHFLQSSLSLFPNLQKKSSPHQQLVEKTIVDGINVEYFSSNNIVLKQGLSLGTLFYKLIAYYLKFDYKNSGISMVNGVYNRSDSSCIFRIDAPFKTVDTIASALKPNKFNNYLVEMIITEYQLRNPTIKVNDLFNKNLSLFSCGIDFS